MEPFNAWNFSLKFSEHDREMSLLPKNIDAETSFIAERVTAIARASSQIVVNQTAIPLHEGEGDLLRLVGSECVNRRIDRDWFELSEIFDWKRVADGKVQSGEAALGLQHRRYNLAQAR